MVRALHRAGPDDEPVLYLAIGGLTNLAVARGTALPLHPRLRRRRRGARRRARRAQRADARARPRLARPRRRPGRPSRTIDGRRRDRRARPPGPARRRAPDRRRGAQLAGLPPHAGGRRQRVARACMTGPAAAIPGFDVALASELGMPVEQGRRRRRARRHRRRPRHRRRRPGRQGGPGMRAVNLIPVEERRGCAAAARGSGVAAYIVLGVLAAAGRR